MKATLVTYSVYKYNFPIEQYIASMMKCCKIFILMFFRKNFKPKTNVNLYQIRIIRDFIKAIYTFSFDL